MKEMVRWFMKWVMLVLLILDVILLSVILARCQDQPKQIGSVHEQHKDLVDLEDDVRFVSVTFLSKDDNLIYWKRELRYEVKLSSFAYGKATIFDSKPEGTICVLYCKSHLFAYFVAKCK